jgi:hypothetical protein
VDENGKDTIITDYLLSLIQKQENRIVELEKDMESMKSRCDFYEKSINAIQRIGIGIAVGVTTLVIFDLIKLLH